MDNVNKTLYIPLYGKALVSRKGILLHDPKAEEIWAAGGFPLKGKSRSKWLAYYMAMRGGVFDRWLARQLRERPEAAVLHIGCGLDSRCLRVAGEGVWYDIDFPDVIRERSRFYQETDRYRMIGADAREPDMLEGVPRGGDALVVMEGISMYLEPRELTGLLGRLTGYFGHVKLLLDCYTEFAARASRYKNPINDVGVTRVFGIDDPLALTENTGLRFLGEGEMTPADMIGQLPKGDRGIFRTVYGGAVAKKLYRLYEYEG